MQAGFFICNYRKSKGMAGVTGLEPAASCVTGMRSNQLSYTPIRKGKTKADF